MFDIGFSELLLIGVVALIVIGPERLPKVARTAGAWLGRLNRYVSDVKHDIDREMRMDELRKLQDEMKASAQKYEVMADQVESEVKREVGDVDKVIQAMSRTDGGLTASEAEKVRAEAAAAAVPEGGAETAPSGVEAALNAPLEPAAADPVTVATPAPGAEPSNRAA
ncbi:twin-arginine translocase subunit TatB [Parasulfuritortus cantonensis]|uniref:Sec-independent protein translocase protein TatB n=1 Tax=Parasulfuritortus cantonensis TaxID=2528202 RepID=A0A4V2NWT3_9PROT|nr:Sec-independent protein translocase protein TatB [Parasulfuritortus cantonensis]TCJ18512.1 twin-arginine translocase subunit TatB [Parasulfuritortus cantonensis]